MSTVGLTGLVEIQLPERTLRFCDGGFFVYEGQTYRSSDPVFGTIGAMQTMAESVGDIVPAINMTLLPPDATAPVDISKPGHQTSPVRFIIAEYDADSGLITTGQTEFYGQFDQSVLTDSAERYDLTVSIVSLAERLFERNIGNTMNPNWHKSIWPGELGHDNATGLVSPVAWGVEGGPGGGMTGGSGGGITPGGPGGDFMPNVNFV